MKKNAVLLYGLFSAFMLIFLTGCSDKIENISDMNGNEVSTRSLSFTDYYWYNGQKIGINKLNNKKYILFDENNENTLKSYSATTLKFVKEPQLLQLSNKIMKKKLQSSPKNLKWATIETTASSPTLTKLNGIIYEAPYFQTENGTEVGLSHLYYVKLKSDKDVSKLMELASINKVDIIGNNEYMPLWYTLSCSKESTGNALELANKFYETNLFEASEPDLMSDDTPNCVNDSNFSNYQWNLRNTGQNGGTIGVDVNFCNARSITTGSQNVIVAIVDQVMIQKVEHHLVEYWAPMAPIVQDSLVQKQIIVLVSHPSLQIARQCQLVIHWHLLRIVDKRELTGLILHGETVLL